MRMIGSLKSDFCKTVKSAGFLAAVIVTFLLCFTENVYVDRTTARSYSVFESLFELDRQIMYRDDGFCSLMIFKNSLTGYSAMFLPILASFPFAVSQSAGRNSGNIRFSIFRAKRMRYYFSKFICCVISGGRGVMLDQNGSYVGVPDGTFDSLAAFQRIFAKTDLPEIPVCDLFRCAYSGGADILPRIAEKV